MGDRTIPFGCLQSKAVNSTLCLLSDSASPVIQHNIVAALNMTISLVESQLAVSSVIYRKENYGFIISFNANG